MSRSRITPADGETGGPSMDGSGELAETGDHHENASDPQQTALRQLLEGFQQRNGADEQAMQRWLREAASWEWRQPQKPSVRRRTSVALAELWEHFRPDANAMVNCVAIQRQRQPEPSHPHV